MAQRNVGREIAFSLLGGLALAILVGGYIYKSVPTREELAIKMASPPPSASAPSGPSLEDSDRLAYKFAGALAHKAFEQAYALMARPYREAHALKEFEASCSASSFLAGAQTAMIMSTRRTSLPGSAAAPYTFQGRGMLTTRLGNVDANFVFFVEGGQPSILVLSLGGIPVLDGITGKPSEKH